VPWAKVEEPIPVGTDGTTYDVAVNVTDQGVAGNGIVKIARIAAGAARNAAGNPNPAFVATDSEVAIPGLDVDLNGKAEALPTGILILRYLFGFRGQPLTSGVIGTGAKRTDPRAIDACLGALKTSLLDVDLDGTADGMTDGMLVLRYLFGFRGPSLTNGLLAPLAKRSNPAEIASFLDGYMPADSSSSSSAKASAESPQYVDAALGSTLDSAETLLKRPGHARLKWR
jgi:hypothetical protein